ncbi:hypothetical protein NQ317_000503, partial [Molorchus minor]
HLYTTELVIPRIKRKFKPNARYNNIVINSKIRIKTEELRSEEINYAEIELEYLEFLIVLQVRPHLSLSSLLQLNSSLLSLSESSDISSVSSVDSPSAAGQTWCSFVSGVLGYMHKKRRASSRVDTSVQAILIANIEMKDVAIHALTFVIRINNYMWATISTKTQNRPEVLRNLLFLTIH